MKKFKGVLVGFFAILLAIIATACSNKLNGSKDDYTPKSLTVQFVSGQAANKPEARAKPLKRMLSKKLDIPVHVSMSADRNTAVEAMKSKKVDVGLLPPDGYVLTHKQGVADILLQARCYGVKQPGGQATENLVSSYGAGILVKKGSKIKSRKDLKGKNISAQNPTSSARYILPIAELEERGLNVPEDCELVTVTGYDRAVLNVLSDDTDATFAFEGARNIVKKDNPKIMDQVVPIYFTKPIPNDTISIRGDMSKSLQKKLAKAFVEVSQSKEGKKVIESAYSHENYTKSKDNNFDIIRKYDEIIVKDER